MSLATIGDSFANASWVRNVVVGHARGQRVAKQLLPLFAGQPGRAR